MTPVFFAVANLREHATAQVLPWEFSPSQTPSDAIRNNKKERQAFYKDASTVWQYYCGCEGASPHQRISKANPTRKLNAVVGDFDLPLDAERIAEAIRKMKFPPTYVERSLGGNARLIWVFSRPLLVASNDFAVYVLQQAREFLQLALLPGLDKAVEDPARLYANGANWTATGAPPVPENALQAFFVKCGESFNFKDIRDSDIPLDAAEAELRKKYPAMSWPGEFVENSQGPSFWVPGSTSTNSAICKKLGMFSFADHADKPFYSWADLLGSEFVADFQVNSVAKATKDVYWDGRLYWVMSETDERFVSLPKEALTTRLRVRARVSTKFGKDGLSMLDKCLDFIHEFGRVEGGAPILFKPPGFIEYNGTRFVNTASKSKLVRPSGIVAEWGTNFPLIARVLENLFEPASQLEPFRCWAAYFYKHAYAGTPSPGQNIVLCGAPGVGKTLVGREVIGGLMGSHCDASKFLTGESNFNSSLFNSAVWCVDDEMCVGSDAANRTFTAHLKSCAANQSFTFRKKFENDVTISWSGRIIVTMNADEASLRAMP